MEERILNTASGDIHYYIDIVDPEALTLVFLPGLTADHTLFERQIEHFIGSINLLSWDAPGHATSRPFSLDHSLEDKANWLDEILVKEGIDRFVLIGQSMGGYVSQAYLQLYPDKPEGFISIDSAPLQKKYVSNFDLFFMEHSEGMYRMYSWKSLLKAGSKGVATTEYGIMNMYNMMMAYNDDPRYYVKLVGHGYRMLAEAIKKDLPYKITCPALLLCGSKDQAGVTRKYNKRWHEGSGIPLHWLLGAGHNSNADKPEEVNAIIEEFIMQFGM